jgi:hypothetical protein
MYSITLWKEEFLVQPFSICDYWKAAWQDVDIFNKNLTEDPTKQVPGFDLPMKIWCKLNRFRTALGHGKCNNMLFHWNIRENPSCECGAEKETIQHIGEECPLTKFKQGFSELHIVTEDVLNWLQRYNKLKTYNLLLLFCEFRILIVFFFIRIYSLVSERQGDVTP